MVAKGALTFVKSRPKFTAIYLIGLLSALTFSGYTLTPSKIHQYDTIIASIDTSLEYEATQQYNKDYQIYYSSKGWFSCDSYCQRNKSRMERSLSNLNLVKSESNSRVSDAKAVAGIYSEIGVSEVRDSFWSYFNRGAKFAKRQTMYDALFTGFRSVGRNESTGEYLMKMVLQLLMNFSIGLIMCLFIFVLGLYSIISSYQPTLFEAITFFFLASSAGFACVSTVLGGMFGGVAVAGFTVAKIAEAQIENGTNNGQRRHLRQD